VKEDTQSQLEPALLAILANRFDTICREMTNTLLRAGRSAVLNVARDFSCSLVTGDNHLLAAAEGLPVHVFGSQFLTQAMCELHPDLVEGDAYIHNDVYLGNTHSADHTILVPVFVDGEHMFTACAKAHQADCGNSLPTTYMFYARDIYEEGAINFPCVQIQRNYKDVQDIIRMCQRRIRVPDQWYGDYLAALGAARIAERRLKELVAKYGRPTVRQFVNEWFDYSERRMINAIRQLPDCQLIGRGAHDPFRGAPDGIPLKVKVKVQSQEGRIQIDLRENGDCLEVGINESRTCAMNNVITGVFNALDPTVPHNSGSFRRLEILLRENCIAGIPRFPTSCSVATTNIADRLVNITQSAFSQIGDGYGLAEGGTGMGPTYAVVSGADWRRQGAPFVNQLIIASNGGPASPKNDGWLTYGLPVVAGLMYRDSVELDELKYPIKFKSMRVRPDSGGPGRFRGAPGLTAMYGPKKDPMTSIYLIDGHHNPAKGVRGGMSGAAGSAAKLDREGGEAPLPPISEVVLKPGEFIVGNDSGGGGYGDPLDRDPERVQSDVLDQWVSIEQAKAIYGVCFKEQDGFSEIDQAATKAQREALRKRRAPGVSQ